MQVYVGAAFPPGRRPYGPEASRDQRITVLERRIFVAGKPLPREILTKLTALGRTMVNAWQLRMNAQNSPVFWA